MEDSIINRFDGRSSAVFSGSENDLQETQQKVEI